MWENGRFTLTLRRANCLFYVYRAAGTSPTGNRMYSDVSPLLGVETEPNPVLPAHHRREIIIKNTTLYSRLRYVPPTLYNIPSIELLVNLI